MPDQTDTYISSFPDAESISNTDKVTGIQGGANKNFKFSSILSWVINSLLSAFVPVSRTINGKGLSSNISLTASDVRARPDTWTPSPAEVGLGNVANERQYSALNPPPLPTPSDIGAQDTITASGILKGDGAGGVSAATAGTDYGTYSKPSGGIPASDLASGVIPAAYTSNPAMDGTASPGSSGAWARGDHVHPSDTTKANQSQLATVESGSTASRNYSVGEYFCWNGLLYRVTSAISSGGTFTPGTNCEQVTVGMAISPVLGRWTPNSNATVISADRCYYTKLGAYLLINVAVILASNLVNHDEIDIISNIGTTFNVNLLTTALTASAGVANSGSINAVPLRFQINSNKLYVRNDSGYTIGTNALVYGQILVPVY